MNITIEERWVAISLGGVAMEKISLPFFYNLGAVLNRVVEFQYDRRFRYLLAFTAYRLDAALRPLMESPTIKLPVCWEDGIELMKSITEAIDSYNEAFPDRSKSDVKLDSKFLDVIAKARRFEPILTAELQKLAAYHVTQKGIYSTTDLIERAENIFPESVLNKMNKEVITEIEESGRCLAFDVATASGFHIIRAIEVVMHDYYISVCKPASKEKLDDWGAYIAALYKLTEDTKVTKSIREDVKMVIALLQLIKDQDRNLIMHPEVFLTPDDAHKLFEIAKSAIIAMTDQLPEGKKKKTLSSKGKAKQQHERIV